MGGLLALAQAYPSSPLPLGFSSQPMLRRPHGRIAVWRVTRRESRVSDAPSMLLGRVGAR